MLNVSISMSLNGTEHMYIVTTRLHMMVFTKCYAYMYLYACISQRIGTLVYEYSSVGLCIDVYYVINGFICASKWEIGMRIYDHSYGV